MKEVENPRILWTISLILIVVVWTFAHASAEPPTKWQGPVGWWSSDIGTTGGAAVQNGDTFEITCDGHDIGGTSDGFHFMFKELTGNGSITARVVSNGTGSDTWAKGGVMIRDDLSPGSAHAMTVVTGGAGGGAAFQWRVRPDRISGSAQDPTPNVSPPYWVRIEKTRRYLSSYLSSDGRTWRQQGVTKTIAVNDPVYIGLCITSGDVGSLRTYTFDNVSYEGYVIDRPLDLVASQPVPADGNICTNNWVNISWMPGELAGFHQVYFSIDLNAVTQRKSSAFIGTTDALSTTVGVPESGFPQGLRMGKTYYWCVDEVNEVEPDSPWHGDVWSFRVPDEDEPAVYLLITNERLAKAFGPLVQRRTEQGFAGRLLTFETICASYFGEDEPEQIRNCIVDHYGRYGTQYVALGGDQAVVPVRWCDPRSSGAYMPADLYYADMDGSDWDVNRNGIYGEVGEVNEIELTPEVHLGRIPVRTTEQAAAYINKVVTYETASTGGFANSLICISDWGGLASGTARWRDFHHHDPVSQAEYHQTWRYYHCIQPYWQAVPFHFLWDMYSSWDTERCGDYELTIDHVNQKLNEGYHFVFYWGHANYNVWDLAGRGFRAGHAAALTNPIPSIVVSWACSPAGFDSDGICMSEAFLQNPHGGAVAYFGHTRPAGGGEANCEQLFLAVFRDHARTTGEAITRVMAALAPDRISDPYRQYYFVLHGDPCIQFLEEESGRHLQIFQPKGCEVIERGSDFYIRWNAAGMGFAAGEKVKLEYSPNSGHTWYSIPGAQSLPYNGRSFRWRNCPLTAGSHYRVLVVSLSDTSVSDMSGRDFTIGDLARLTIQSAPVEGISIVLSGSKTDDCTLVTDFNITILEGATVNVSAPLVAGDSSEFAFVRWKDESGNTMTTTVDYTFTLIQDKTLVAEYAGP